MPAAFSVDVVWPPGGPLPLPLPPGSDLPVSVRERQEVLRAAYVARPGVRAVVDGRALAAAGSLRGLLPERALLAFACDWLLYGWAFARGSFAGGSLAWLSAREHFLLEGAVLRGGEAVPGARWARREGPDTPFPGGRSVLGPWEGEVWRGADLRERPGPARDGAVAEEAVLCAAALRGLLSGG